MLVKIIICLVVVIVGCAFGWSLWVATIKPNHPLCLVFMVLEVVCIAGMMSYMLLGQAVSGWPVWGIAGNIIYPVR